MTGVAEGMLIGGGSAAVGLFVPMLIPEELAAYTALFTALVGMLEGGLVDGVFQACEKSAGISEGFDWVRLGIAAGGGAVGTIGLPGLHPGDVVVDAICASIVSGGLSTVYGCVDTTIKWMRHDKKYQRPTTAKYRAALARKRRTTINRETLY